MGADVAIRTDPRAFKDDDELPDARAGTDTARLHVGQAMDERLTQDALALSMKRS
jgi:hypothetical protein